MYRRQKENIILGISFLISPLYSLPLVCWGIRKNNRFAFFLWAVFMGMIGLIYAPTGDLYRYFLASKVIEGMNLEQITHYCILTNEFVQGYMFFILYKLGINYDISRFLYQFVSYLLLGGIYIDIINNNKNWHGHRLLLFLIIMPITFSLFLFRFYFSVVLFIFGTTKIIQGKKCGWLFIILAVLNHFSFIVFLIGLLFYRTQMLQLKKSILVFFSCVALFCGSETVLSAFRLLPDVIVDRYIGYLDGYYAGDYLNDHSFKYKLWIFFTNLTAYIGIVIYIIGYKRKSNLYSSVINLLLIITSLTSFFATIFNRFLILLFIAVRVYWGYFFKGKPQAILMKSLIVPVIIFNLLNIWSKRREFLLSDYSILLYQTAPQILMFHYSQEWINQHVLPDGDYILK